VAEVGKRQRAHKEDASQHGRGSRQEVGTAARAEQTARAAAAKSRTHVGSLAVLDKDETDHADGRKHLDRKDDGEENAHSNTPVFL
jgi:hypothetical protein